MTNHIPESEIHEAVARDVLAAVHGDPTPEIDPVIVDVRDLDEVDQ